MSMHESLLKIKIQVIKGIGITRAFITHYKIVVQVTIDKAMIRYPLTETNDPFTLNFKHLNSVSKDLKMK